MSVAAWFAVRAEGLSRGIAGPSDSVLDGDAAQLPLPATPKAAGLARSFVRELLLPSTSPATVDAVTLCVSELVTNALDHAAPPFELRIACDEGLVRIEVSDSTTTRPVQRDPEPSALRGRGLQFV